MSYSSLKDKERAYEQNRGSHVRVGEQDDDEIVEENQCSDKPTDTLHGKGSREEEREERDQRSLPRRSDNYHLTRTTKVMQEQFSGTAIYPPKKASDEEHKRAQALRVATRVDENDERYEADHARRGKISWENRAHFDRTAKNKIEARDFAYDPKDERHTRSASFTRDHSLDRDTINKWATDN